MRPAPFTGMENPRRRLRWRALHGIRATVPTTTTVSFVRASTGTSLAVLARNNGPFVHRKLVRASCWKRGNPLQYEGRLRSSNYGRTWIEPRLQLSVSLGARLPVSISCWKTNPAVTSRNDTSTLFKWVASKIGTSKLDLTKKNEN